MTGHKLRNPAQEEALQPSFSVRANHDQVGLPIGGGVDQNFTDVPDLYLGADLESRCAQLLGRMLDEAMRVLSLPLQLRRIAGVHLRRRRANGLQNVQHRHFSRLRTKLLHHGPG